MIYISDNLGDTDYHFTTARINNIIHHINVVIKPPRTMKYFTVIAKLYMCIV